MLPSSVKRLKNETVYVFVCVYICALVGLDPLVCLMLELVSVAAVGNGQFN